ncbi:MAG: hypothetical protein S4CHLAM123_07230 [Chlamydiales bacterium]|nr:hypothetical protein [Chlamydiales bacterium]
MLRLAIKMMVGDRAKFLAIIIGLTFATFIITQQAGIFIGLMSRTFGFLTDTSQAHIWVMDPQVQFVDDIKTIRFNKLYQVRSTEGVEWAVPMFKGLVKGRLTNGQFQTCNVIGIDDATLIGGPPRMEEGSLLDLRQPDAVIINVVGAADKLASPTKIAGHKIPMKVGDRFELNDKRARVVGLCKVTRTFLSQPVVYTTFSRAISYSPKERHLLTFILAKAQEGENLQALTKKIRANTGLAAYTTKEFKKLTVMYYIVKTGIAINFGVAVILGYIIGAAIAGQTFYTFAHDNRRFFATFKAMGATNQLLAKMVLIQALMTSSLSWGLGMGVTALFGFFSKGTELSFVLPWWLFLISALSILCITMASALFGLYKIVRLDPGIVFQT